MSAQTEIELGSQAREKADDEEESENPFDDALEPEDEPPKKYRWYSPRWHLLETDRFVTSFFVRPSILAAYRVCVFFYMTSVVVAQGINNQFKGGESFKYFTWMSFFSLYAYFLFASIHTIIKAINGRPTLMDLSPRFLNCTFWLLYELEATYHLVVPLIYWGLLADNAPKPNEDPFGFWIDVSVHGLEAGFILGDVFLNRNIMLTSHVLFMVVFALGYCGYAWIWYAFGYDLPYEFLKIWWYYIALPIFFLIMYFLVFFVHVGKEKAFGKKYAAKQARLESSVEL